MPSLEHNNEIRGESLDLIRYIDSNFDGPALLPEVRLLIRCHLQCSEALASRNNSVVSYCLILEDVQIC